MKDVPDFTAVYNLAASVAMKGVKAEPGGSAIKRGSGPPGSASGHIAITAETAAEDLFQASFAAPSATHTTAETAEEDFFQASFAATSATQA